jgi:hypothetical protein
MHDEDLREEFAAWLRPVREAEPPTLPVIRHRLRRRRARQAAGATVALAAVAGLAVAVNATLGPPRPPASSYSPTLRSNIPVTTSDTHPIAGGYQISSAYMVSAPVSALEVYGGTVTVTGSQRSTVSVSEHVEYFGSGSRPVMVRNLTGKKVTLEYGCSGDPLCVVSYDIQVPRNLGVLVDSAGGDIRLSSLAGRVAATRHRLLPGEHPAREREGHGHRPAVLHVAARHRREQQRGRRDGRAVLLTRAAVRAWGGSGPARTR